MGTDQIQGFLSGKAKRSKINFLRKGITKFNMIILQGTLLTGLHWITVEDARAACTVGAELKSVCKAEFTTAIWEKNFNILVEQFSAEGLFQKIYSVYPSDNIIAITPQIAYFKPFSCVFF